MAAPLSSPSLAESSSATASTSPRPNPPATPLPAANASSKWHNPLDPSSPHSYSSPSQPSRRLRPRRRRRRAHHRARPRLRPHEEHERGRSGYHVTGLLVGAGEVQVMYISGVMTPTEILSAYDSGAKIVKVYPVSALGGSRYISALKRPFHHISMVASQGIKIDSVREYITQGAPAVVLSDAIFDKDTIS